MAFGLGAGLGFAFVELGTLDPPLYLVGRTADLERDICKHLGIGLDLLQTDDSAEGWAWLKAELDAGRPTMVWADIQHLEYLRVRLHMTMHDIVVTGYDEEAGVAFIADNDRDQIQKCSFAGLARARNSDSFPAPNRHATWVMDFPPALPDPAEAVVGAVRAAIRNMASGGTGVAGGEAGMGLRGVTSFRDSYRAWPERFGDRLDSVLKALRVFIVKAGTGGALFRSLHAEFLHDAGVLLADDGLEAPAAVYDELAATWVALSNVGDHADGVALVERAVVLERDGVAAMEQWLTGVSPRSG